MNIRNTVRAITLAGTAAAIPLSAQATDTSTGGILGYATSGTITSDLAAGAVTSRCADAGTGNSAISCGIGPNGGTAGSDAFLQETISDGSDNYVRQVVLDTGSEGLTVMEWFVPMGGSGIRGHHVIEGNGFYSEFKKNSDDYNVSAADGIEITQLINDGDLEDGYWFHENSSGLGATAASNVGRELAIDQTVHDGTELQRFVKVEHDANFIPTFNMTVNGTNFNNTTATQDISVTWIGSNVGSTYGLEDVLANAGASTEAGTGNDNPSSPGFTGTTPVTALGFGWDSNLNFHGVQPSFP